MTTTDTTKDLTDSQKILLKAIFDRLEKLEDQRRQEIAELVNTRESKLRTVLTAIWHGLTVAKAEIWKLWE